MSRWVLFSLLLLLWLTVTVADLALPFAHILLVLAVISLAMHVRQRHAALPVEQPGSSSRSLPNIHPRFTVPQN